MEQIKSKKTKISITIIAISAIVIAIFTVLIISNNDSFRIKKGLKSANSHLDKLDYDNAIANFKGVLDIDINNKEAYKGLMSAYIGNGNYPEYRETLEIVKLILGDTFTEDDETALLAQLKESHTHDFSDATCDTPEICEICGEEGIPALGHDFLAATCIDPSTCNRCNATEGEALGHDFEEANMWAPKTCKICQATEGDPLPGELEQLGISCCTDLNTSVSGNLVSHNIPFTLTLSDYRCFKGDATHEEKEGYVWQSITFHNEMSLASDAWDYYRAYLSHDYYNTTLADNSEKRIKPEYYSYSLIYNGKQYDYCIRFWDESKNDYYPQFDGGPAYSRAIDYRVLSFRVPEGYDGTVVAFYTDVCDFLNNTDLGYYFRLPPAISE